MPADLGAGLIGLLAGSASMFVVLRGGGRRAAPADSDGHVTVVPSESASMRRVLRALPFAAFVFDQVGRITFMNESAEMLFDLSAARAYGRMLIEVVPSVDFERQVEEALRGNSSTRDVRVIQGEHERIFGVTSEPLDDEGAIAIAADRTALVSIERVRRDFVSNVSHELRTPLAAIKLMIETVLLAGDDDSEARAMFLPRISREVDRMVVLVEDLLELARSESGRLVLRKERFDLTDIATSVINTFAQRADALDVRLDLDAPEPVMVEADRNRLTQVAVNLVDNALRHTPARGTVGVEVAHDAGSAVLRVRDTGIGIPYSDLPHIFERFYVVDRSRARGHSGTGLGLSIARRMVEAHNGTLDAQSALGRGSTFTCRLPLAIEPAVVNIKDT